MKWLPLHIRQRRALPTTGLAASSFSSGSVLAAALSRKCMFSPTPVVARSGPSGLPFSRPNLRYELETRGSHEQLTWPILSSRPRSAIRAEFESCGVHDEWSVMSARFRRRRRLLISKDHALAVKQRKRLDAHYTLSTKMQTRLCRRASSSAVIILAHEANNTASV